MKFTLAGFIFLKKLILSANFGQETLNGNIKYEG
jgi:hypothetical protein